MSSKSKGIRKQSIFIRCINIPIRVLARGQDLYLKSLTGFGGPISYGNAMGCPTPHIPSVPRSPSADPDHRTAEGKLRDLMRLGSTRRLEQPELRRSRSAVPLGSGGMVPSVPRSKTVVFRMIDEEKSYDDGEDDDMMLLGRAVNYQRARSYAGR
ncbi:hypothetical protein OROGR_028595 [Orobanche gracilis]